MNRIKYWNRIFKAYILGNTSHLSFWHGTPQVNPRMKTNELGQYYMPFHNKADYKGQYDEKGIPMLDYQGHVGLQYNPIAIAQWGLGNYNLWRDNKDLKRYDCFIKCADWLCENLEQNEYNLWVWNHHFDFEYRDTLKSPWYSGLAQGQGISVLVRAFKETNNKKYNNAVQHAFQAFLALTSDGGVNYVDTNGNNWIEEYIVHPPTHILNGFMWALWGIYDYALQQQDEEIMNIFYDYKKTLVQELESYDTGFWSLYEHSGTWLKMIASSFYHQLHIVQLRVMYRLTGENIFDYVANKWTDYLNRSFNRKRAVVQKFLFKVLYY